MSHPDHVVFISYSHDSDDHRAHVLSLSERLRQDGINTILDRYVNGSPAEGWPRWMLNGLDAAARVLCVCTETYYRRFRGHEAPGKGKGVDWEGAIITQELYDARRVSQKFIPVLFEGGDEDHIPEPLRGQTHYRVHSEEGYQALYDALLGQSGVEPGQVGQRKTKSRAKGQPLAFETAAPTKVLWPTKLRHAADCLVGRETELALLHQAWDAPETHLLVIRGKGGEGKTALVAAWMAEMAAKDWRGAERVLDWSFYSQGTRDQTTATAEVFLHDALEHLGDPDPNAGDATARATRLARLIGEQRCLLVLDGLEPLQYPPGPLHGALKDPGMAALLRGLAARNAGLCVVTTRERVVEVEAHYGRSAVDHELQFLSPRAGAQLLHHSGARRAGKKAIAADDKELQDASREVHGHALTLSLIGQYLRLTAEGDIRQRDRMKLAEADREYTNDATRPYGHAFKAMEAYERWFADGDPAARRQLAALRLLGLFDRPAPADCLAALRGGEPIPGLTEEWTGTRGTDWNIALSRLQEINLVSVGEDDAVDCHPLLREYFAMRLKEKHPDAFRAGHSRLFDHLCKTTEPRPDTLAGLQPLYQAVTHGCLAGRHPEAKYDVYEMRILRGTGHDGFYSTRKLGAIGADLGAVAAFFDEPWTRLSPHLSAPAQAWLLAVAAFNLRALGRLTEAVEPMRVSLKMCADMEDWKQAAIRASNLSELEVTLGRLGEAVADGRRAIEFADRSGDAFLKLSKRTTAADALHQAGERAEAGALFAEAERMQAEDQPEFPLLYSLQGFRYADLLLAPAERAAWQATLDCGSLLPLVGGSPAAVNVPHPSLTLDAPALAKPDDSERGQETHTPAGLARESGSRLPQSKAAEAAIAEAERRANEVFRWRRGTIWNPAADPLLDIALDHLTQARAALYRALLTPDPPFDIRHSTFGIPTALAKLRAANSQHHLPKALLTAAFYHGTLGGDPAEAARLLDEAQQIAERGPMPLHLADVHLHRARLAGMTKDEWRMPNGEAVDPKAELAKARELIEKHRYWRRREELEDAEAASVHW
jgi:tetratricopeptide (TPR) repeat protein